MPDKPTNPTPEYLAAQASAFATLPDIYARIRHTLDDPASTHTEVADVIGTDPAIAARILKIANSAFYGRTATIARIPQAVGLLGTQQVHDLVLATVVIAGSSPLFGDRKASRAFWRHSLTTASAAKAVAEDCNILDAERLFVAGLISQLGQLVLAEALPDETAGMHAQAQAQTIDVAKLQRDHLGFDHATVGAALFQAWQLPPEIIVPIQWHTQPQLAGEQALEASIINIAAGLANAIIDDMPLDELAAALDETAWTTIGLSRDRLDVLRQTAVALTEEIAPILIDIAA